MSTFTLSWTAADGTTTALSRANGLLITKGPVGLDAPPVQNALSQFTTTDGASLGQQRYPERAIALPMFVEHPTRVATRIAELARMVRQPGTLTRTDDTTTRQLRRVIYSGGLEGDLSTAASPVWRRLVLSLVALDPFWYGPTSTQALTIGTGTGFDDAVSFDAGVPFDGGLATSISVDGDLGAFPVFSITGPATTLVVTDGTDAWQIAAALSSGQTLTIDTRPTTQGPRLGSGGVDWSLLTEASRLFELRSGTSSLIAAASGTSAATSVTVSWESRWLTP